MVRWGSSAAMGDYETSDDESERPTALEADIDGGSSVSSIATDHADNVSIDTIESDFDSSDDEANIHFGRGRRSAEEREIALERNSLRRQASNDLLAAMHASTKSIVKDGEQATSREPLRRAPPRTKSGDGLGQVENLLGVPHLAPKVVMDWGDLSNHLAEGLQLGQNPAMH